MYRALVCNTRHALVLGEAAQAAPADAHFVDTFIWAAADVAKAAACLLFYHLVSGVNASCMSLPDPRRKTPKRQCIVNFMFAAHLDHGQT